ncbi:MAG: TAXI family TRAP transporter solute-binding subunit [Hyphomicrobiaceae bacterium]|nr:TAXI family TRAP transporter solute-binding subunit [Hyphomicrobiaceae bacterium]
MSSQHHRFALRRALCRRSIAMCAAWLGGMLALGAVGAAAQTYGIATMQPGTLNHTTGSAIAKVLKEKGGLNVLVQPTAGETTLIPMVGRAEAELGIANIAEVVSVTMGGTAAGQQPDLRLIGSIHPLRTGFYVRKDSDLRTIADLKGKRVPVGYSAMRTLDTITTAVLATAGLTPADVKAVPVPNVVRGADELVGGNADTFTFAFGGGKLREVDATVGGLRVLEISDAGMAASRKVFPYGYLSEVDPGPAFIGVAARMKVYAYDNMLFTNTKVTDEVVYKIIETMENNKAELVAVQPALRDFSAGGLYKQYDIPYHPGAVKYFKDKGYEPKATQ